MPRAAQQLPNSGPFKKPLTATRAACGHMSNRAQQLPPGGVTEYAPKSRLRIVLGWASMRWSQRWPMRILMDRIFSKADAIDLPEYRGLSVEPMEKDDSKDRRRSRHHNDQRRS